MSAQSVYERFRVCEMCSYHYPLSARHRLEQLLDKDSFRETGKGYSTSDPLKFSDRKSYTARLAEAHDRSDSEESVITGVGTINGQKAVLAVSEFGFLGGSMGAVMGEKVALALDLAASKRLPFIAVTSSGGARMQEGMVSLVQMATTSAAAMRLKQAGMPFISVLAHPTTGGVYASYASLADITLAEPEALIGFAGPRVFETVTGQAPLPDTQSAESLYEHGWIDEIVDRTRLQDRLGMLLQLFHSGGELRTNDRPVSAQSPPHPPSDAWDTVQLARHPNRPTAQYYIQRMLTSFVELHGDRHSGDDPAVVCGIGDLAGSTVLVIALERGNETEADLRRNGRARPDGYRKALRIIHLASQLQLPLLTLIDTPGAWLDHNSDVHGLAPSIAACLGAMAVSPVPIIAAVIGEGGSGGALALGIADRILMQENAVYSVIAPEGAAAIIYRDSRCASEVAEALKITATDCRMLGVVDTIVPEPMGGAANKPEHAVLLLENFIVQALSELRTIKSDKLLKERNRKFRQMGRRTIKVQRPDRTLTRFKRPKLRDIRRPLDLGLSVLPGSIGK